MSLLSPAELNANNERVGARRQQSVRHTPQRHAPLHPARPPPAAREHHRPQSRPVSVLRYLHHYFRPRHRGQRARLLRRDPEPRHADCHQPVHHQPRSLRYFALHLRRPLHSIVLIPRIMELRLRLMPHNAFRPRVQRIHIYIDTNVYCY